MNALRMSNQWGWGLVFELPTHDTTLIVGRHGNGSTKADIEVKTRTASRIHAVITVDGGGVRIRDANSRNGTFVNSQKMRPETDRLLRNGDQIKVGDDYILFQSKK